MSNQIDPMYDLYLKEHYRHQSLHEKNLINQENAMITLSIALLAGLTALGDKLILADKTLAIITIVFLATTILQVVVGYMLSNVFFARIKSKLRENYMKYQTDGSTELGGGVSDSLAGKTNDILNISTPITFLLSLVFFLVLVVIYAGGIK